jgi:hypothetical protein
MPLMTLGFVVHGRLAASIVSTLGPEHLASVVRSRARQPVLGNAAGGS